MVEAIFTETTTTLTLAGLTQWDYGQKLHIKGLDLPEVAQVHFCNTTQDEAIVRVATKQGDEWVCDIPNELLEDFHDIKSWIYETNEEHGETIKTIYLKVKKRAKPQDFISENEDAASILDDVVNKINQNIQDNTKFKVDISNQQAHFEENITVRQNEFETKMNEAEALRVGAEQGRVNAENERVQAETLRANAEQLRANAENKRANAEVLRVEAEIQRASAEQLRTNAENERVQAEQGRVNAEKSRVSAETDRNTTWLNLKKEIEELLKQGIIDDSVVSELFTWSSKKINDTKQNKIIVGTTPPTDDMGADGDIYIQVEV